MMPRQRTGPDGLRAEARPHRAGQRRITARRICPGSLSSGTSWGGSDRNDFTLFNNRSIDLSLSWSLFNGFGRERDLVTRQVALDAARAREADERRRVGAALTSQLAALSAAEQRARLTEQNLETARASARVQTERYRLGSIGIVELNAAQDALSTAETDAVSARFDYLRAKAEIEAILGRPLTQRSKAQRRKVAMILALLLGVACTERRGCPPPRTAAETPPRPTAAAALPVVARVPPGDWSARRHPRPIRSDAPEPAQERTNGPSSPSCSAPRPVPKASRYPGGSSSARSRGAGPPRPADGPTLNLLDNTMPDSTPAGRDVERLRTRIPPGARPRVAGTAQVRRERATLTRHSTG